MAIKIKSTLSEKKTFAKREKFVVTGDYLCTVTGGRFQPEDKDYADRYFIDLKVTEGPALVGAEASWAKFMKAKYKNITTGAGGIFTAKQQEDLDEEAVQVAFAAVLGLSRDESVQLAGGQPHEGKFEKVFVDGDASGIIGRSVIARVYINKKGYTNVDLYPVVGSTKVSASLPKAPPAVKKPTFEQLASKAGFVVHPDDSDYYMNEETEEVVEASELRSRLV